MPLAGTGAMVNDVWLPSVGADTTCAPSQPSERMVTVTGSSAPTVASELHMPAGIVQLVAAV